MSDYQKQIRQIIEQTMRGEDSLASPFDIEECAERVAEFVDGVRAAMIEEAVRICKQEATNSQEHGEGSLSDDDVQSYFRGRVHGAEECHKQIAKLSPDPHYGEKLKGEERERIRKTVLNAPRRTHFDLKPGEATQMVPLNDVLAAIEKEQG